MKILELTYKGKSYCVILDKEDWRRVKKYKWHINFSKGCGRRVGDAYVRATVNGRKAYLHRFLMQDVIEHRTTHGCTSKEAWWQVDHKNHQTLDCRKKNLEVVSHIENLQRKRTKRRTEFERQCSSIANIPVVLFRGILETEQQDPFETKAQQERSNENVG